MNERILRLKQRTRDGEHHVWRQRSGVELLAECEAEGLSLPRRVARLVRRQCEAEAVVIEPEERIVFTRTLPAAIPAVLREEEWDAIKASYTLHELGPISNVCADWGMVLQQGLLGRRAAGDHEGRPYGAGAEFLECAVETIDAVLALAARYAATARRVGRDDVAAVLERVPAHPARTFHEALQALRLLHAVVWLGGNYHVGLGRFDQYMWPYLAADLEARRLDVEAAEELLAEFFISLNRDSDLYPGVQQGDNGQTITLGGMTRDGADGVNELTRMALRVSRDLAMIDPKINLRISAQTDLDLLCLATELTRKGLGFPQYSNDDVVIPGLVAHGYALEDARDYAVAACWEFLIPGRGMDVVNIGAVSLPAAVDCGIRGALAAGDGGALTLDGILQRAGEDIRRQVEALAGAYRRLWLMPAPYYSVLMTDCLERGQDLSQGATYNNFGIHGAGLANAADALAAVRRLVLEEGRVAAAELLAALEANYAGYEELRCLLETEGPKVGNNDDRADDLMVALADLFVAACEGYTAGGATPRGGILRPGTGSAMYYVWLAQGHAGMREPVAGATAEGRRAGEMFGANLAPSPNATVAGPISVLQSFAKLNYGPSQGLGGLCNGGPITLELSDTVFRGEESLRKTAMLVRAFAQLGCQQLQLNSLNVDMLREAKAHPERHKNLIVRVWGWSGYFCELDAEYQDHIIARHVYAA